MTFSYIIPNWFFGFDIGMEVLFGLVTLAVSIFAFKIYKISKEKKIRDFSLGFLLISLAYIIWAVTNLILVKDIGNGFHQLVSVGIPVGYITAIYVHMILFVSGLITLAYVTLKIEKGQAYYLLLSLGLLAIVSSLNKLITFRIVSAFLLIFITYNYLKEYNEKKNKKTFWILTSFTILMISSLDFIFVQYNPFFYVIGHVLELIAYTTMLTALFKGMKR